MKGMLSTECTREAFEELVSHPEWVMEQKFDGTRALIEIVSETEMVAYQRNGKPLKHTAALQHLDLIFDGLVDLEPGTVLDGEIMVAGGEYYVFDLVRHPELSPRAEFIYRRSLLVELPLRGSVSVVRQVVGSQAKSELLAAVEDAGAEGVVAKHLHSSYESGARVKHVLKRKFVKTADLVVTEVNRPDPRHGSFSLAAHSDATGVLTPVGACSAIGKPHVEVGDVIEVNFLFWTGTNVYQPRMMRVREDKAARECTLNQFRPYSRKAV